MACQATDKIDGDLDEAEGLQKSRSNLVLTVHTVVSRFNQHRFRHPQRPALSLNPTLYITEVAEERVESTRSAGASRPTPTLTPRSRISSASRPKPGPRKALPGSRRRSARNTTSLQGAVLYERTQVIACYVGWASAHIAPNGDLGAAASGPSRSATCARRTTTWRRSGSGRMAALRKSIYEKECACPMANASYANMLLHPPTRGEGGAGGDQAGGVTRGRGDVETRDAGTWSTGTRGRGDVETWDREEI